MEEFSLAVKIRLARHGAKKRPYYRVVVADGRMPRDGRYIEEVGRYNPLTSPKTIDINLEKVDEWVAKGAQPTSAVSHLIEIARTGAPVAEKKTKLSKKAQARLLQLQRLLLRLLPQLLRSPRLQRLSKSCLNSQSPLR